MISNLTYKKYGGKAILIEWKPEISKTTLAKMLAFKEAILKDKGAVLDVILGYHSITIFYNFIIKNFEQEKKSLISLYASTPSFSFKNNTIFKIPVCYNNKFGIDLEEFAKEKNLQKEEIIHLHTQPIYTVFFIGFLPGFPYLSGLDAKLFVDRKSNPRIKVPKGSVAIGGKQTGIYPHESAGGWTIIGKTPLQLFDVKNENPCLLKSGDQIKFTNISFEEFLEIKNQIKKGEYVIDKADIL